MSTLQLVWKNISRQLGSTLLSIILTAFGAAILCVIFISSDTLEKQLDNNTKNIDLVVGAKGSPLQLILSSLYHVDNPTGNISLSEAENISNNPFVELAVPLSLGDNYNGHRIVGTDSSFLELYGMEVAEGTLFQSDYQVTIGAEVARKHRLQIGDEVHGSHGLSSDGHIHDEHPFKVVGILKKADNIVDNLLLCNLQSVWDVHGIHHDDHEHTHEEHAHPHEDHQHAEAEEDQQHHSGEEHSHSETELHDNPHEGEVFVKSIGEDLFDDQGLEITSLLIKYRSPAAIGIVPRLVNQSTNLQSASPAIESSRLFSLLGIGMDSLALLAYAIIIIAGLSVFISLYNALKIRKFDLAIMRTMGAPKIKLFSLLIFEGLIITLTGGIIGLLLGHGVLFYIGQNTSESADFIQAFTLHKQELYILLASCAIGVIASLLPAVKAYNTTIATILSEK